MTGSELKTTGIQLYGERGWQSALAEALGRERTQIWRYVQNDKVPVVIELAVRQLLAEHKSGSLDA